MLVATAIMLLGLLMGIVAAQLGGLRLGGVVVVPLIAVYVLRSFGSLPVFLTSVIAAYVSVAIIKSRVPIYGRPLFIVTIVIGTLVPVTIFELLEVELGFGAAISEIEFVGSILPGIAAYNFHRLSKERRVEDALWSLAALLLLVVVGIGLVIVVGLTPLAGVLPPVLLAPDSDIARAFGLTVDTPPLSIIAPRWVFFGLVVLGTTLSEGVRLRYGLRVAGVIVIPIVVLISFRNGWMLGVWALTVVLAYAAIQLIHWWTLIYGRVLLSMAIIVGLLVAITLTVAAPVEHGVLPFFVGILGGVAAYNVHVLAPAERRAATALVLGTVVVVAAVARVFVTPLPGGIIGRVTAVHLAVGALALALAAWELYRLERILPHGITDEPDELGTTVQSVSSKEGGL